MRDSLDAVLLIAVRTVFLYTKKKAGIIKNTGFLKRQK